MRELSDQELVKRFQRGDRDAFEAFSERHRVSLYRMAFAWLGDTMLAEDAVQEAFTRSYTGLLKFRFRAAPKTWLVRVCRNVCQELRRKQDVSTNSDEAKIGFDADEFDAGEGTSLSTVQLSELLDHLPPQQRDVIVLRILEEYSVKDTARVLRIREGTVKAHTSKALNNLRNYASELGITLDE